MHIHFNFDKTNLYIYIYKTWLFDETFLNMRHLFHVINTTFTINKVHFSTECSNMCSCCFVPGYDSGQSFKVRISVHQSTQGFCSLLDLQDLMMPYFFPLPLFLHSLPPTPGDLRRFVEAAHFHRYTRTQKKLSR